MISVTFGQWAEWTQADQERVALNDRIGGVSIDSRTIQAGHLFVALPGTETHGHAFVEQVWAAGGVALVESSFAGHGGPMLRVASPLRAMAEVVERYIAMHHIKVVAVTGSVGKTSIKELVGAALSGSYMTGVTAGNYNTAIGIPLSFFSADPAMTHFVAEMGMRFRGEITRLTQITPPDVAIISNIGPSHLETLGSMDAIQAAKGEILDGLKHGGTAVLNFDDPRVRYLGNTLKDHPVLWYGETQGLDATIESSQLEGDHTEVRLRYQGQTLPIRLPWIGTHQALNAAAAFLAGVSLGLTVEQAIGGIEAVAPDRSRIRRQKLGSIDIIEDDYNASPVSVQAALAVLAEQSGRRLAVLGDILELGSQEGPLHRQVGVRVATTADVLVAVGPRAKLIAEEAQARELPVYTADTLEEAYTILTDLIQPGDVILVKASHGVGLERLVRQLTAWGGPQ